MSNLQSATPARALRIGIAGPVGSGKTALVEALCRTLVPRLDVGVVTNDIYTKEDALFLLRRQVLPEARVRGVETGGCPHAAISRRRSMPWLPHTYRTKGSGLPVPTGALATSLYARRPRAKCHRLDHPQSSLRDTRPARSGLAFT